MTNPTEHFTAPGAGSCEFFQWEISQALDERQPFSHAVREHLHTCPQCATFAEAWGEEGVLSGPLSHAPALDSAVTHRIVQRALSTDTAATMERPRRARSAPLLRWAAVVALGAIGWWLLDPRVAPPPSTSHIAPAPGATSPALAMHRQVARLEQPLAHEQAALQGAAADGFTHLREVLAWSSSVLQ